MRGNSQIINYDICLPLYFLLFYGWSLTPLHLITFLAFSPCNFFIFLYVSVFAFRLIVFFSSSFQISFLYTAACSRTRIYNLLYILRYELVYFLHFHAFYSSSLIFLSSVSLFLQFFIFISFKASNLLL